MTPLAVVALHRRQRRADDAALALRSQGIDASVARGREGFRVEVPDDEAERARRVLALFEEENREGDEADPLRALPDEPFPWLATGAAFLALAAFFAVTGPRESDSVFFQVGSARASRILLGEWWRTITALCLHADLGHLVGNVLTGVLFVGFASRRLGSGVTWLLVVTAAALANGAGALLPRVGHDSVGASTAVFAAVGLLAALAAVAPTRTERRPYLVGLGAGLALLAMLGTGGERTDLWAHFFGLVAGFALGLPAGLVSAVPMRRVVQAVAGLLAAAAVVAAWTLALGLG